MTKYEDMTREQVIRHAADWIAENLQAAGLDVEYPTRETSALLAAVSFAERLGRQAPGFGIAASLLLEINEPLKEAFPPALRDRLTGTVRR